MAMDARVIDGVLVVRLHGDIDHHAVEVLRDDIETQLRDTHFRGLVLSFQGIDFMDSSGLGLILGRYRTVQQQGGKMAVCEVSNPLRRLFELSGVLKVIPVHQSEDEAIRAVKEA